MLAVLDARMGEVYWAQYRGADLVAGPALCAPEAVSPLAVEGLAACGNGIGAYPEAFAAHAWAAGARPDIMPHAQQIAQFIGRRRGIEIRDHARLNPAFVQQFQCTARLRAARVVVEADVVH